MRLWQEAQVGCVACCAISSRKVLGSAPFFCSLRVPASGGGGGGGVPKIDSRIHLPRRVGLVRDVCEVSARIAPIPSRPPRWFSGLSATRRNSFPSTPSMP